MSVESATYISDLNATYPASGDPKSEGDDHLRLIKTVVKATFPSVTGAVTASHTQLNYVTGVTSAIQTQLDAKAPTASPTFTGTVVVPTPSTSTGAANKTYVDSAILNASLSASIPGQTGNAGKYLTTDGSNASWGTVIPTQTGNSGKYLTTDGSSASWGVAVSPSVSNTFTATQTFKGLIDTVYSIVDGAAFEVDPANGSIQTVTLGANRTPAATNFVAGQCVLLGIDDGTSYAVTWTTINPTWVKAGGTASAPTLATTGYTWVLLWKVGSTMYATEVGKP